MKMNNRRSFPGVIFRGLCCLLLGLAAGFLAFFGLALLRGGEGAGVGDALEAAANKGLLPLLTGAVKEGAIGSLGKSAPLALMALGAAFSWQAGLYNLGGAGQYALGAAAAMLCAAYGLPWYASLPAALAAGALGGAAAGWLKAGFSVHEALSTMLLNWVFVYAGQAALQGKEVPEAACPDLTLPALAGIGVLSVIMTLGMHCTVGGFEIRLLGASEKTARYAGADAQKTMVKALAVSGMLCGAGGGLAFLMGMASEAPGLSLIFAGDGVRSLASALLAFGQPIGSACFALLIGALSQGVGSMDQSVFPPETGDLILAFSMYLASWLMLIVLKRRRGGERT